MTLRIRTAVPAALALAAWVAPPAAAGVHLTDKTWLAEDVGGRGVIDNVQSRISITAAGEVSGSAGCNTLRGTAQLDGGSLAFGALATTRKMCPPAVMDQEARFLQALDRTREFRIDGPYLKLVDAGGAEVIGFTQMR